MEFDSQKWLPTHRIIWKTGTVEEVMLSRQDHFNNGSAYTEAEWKSHSAADYERLQGCIWLHLGKPGNFRVEQIPDNLCRDCRYNSLLTPVEKLGATLCLECACHEARARLVEDANSDNTYFRG
jgi:hypothetical protein